MLIMLLINDLFKESFYEKKNIINVLTVFFIFHKNCVKFFFYLKNGLLINVLKTLVYMTI